MVSVFQSVGAETFDLTLTTLTGEKTRFERSVTSHSLIHRMGSLIEETTHNQRNVIVRPYARPPVFLLQLDDLSEAAVAKITPQAFLCLRTSPGNFQAWLALPEPEESFIKSLRQGVGADPAASGATRVAGSQNFKAKYAPNFPRIQSVHLASGCFADREALRALGVVAEAETTRLPERPSASKRKGKVFPDYERCLQGAPINHGGSDHDRSRADFTFCLLAIDWGLGVQETAMRLMEVSEKAQENGERYAIRTAERAEEAIRRRG